MRGSLHEMEVKQARAGQVETHKRKLQAWKSLGKGGSLLASDALQKIKDKRRKEADDILRKAKTAVTRAENKAKNELNARGIQARKDEKARILLIQQHQALSISLPDHIWNPIRDPEKDPTPAERDALRANQSLYDAVECAQAEWNRVQSENPAVFTDIPIDPMILEAEQQFKISQRPLNQLVIDLEEEEGSRSEGGSDIVSPPRSVISIDSIAENADFISLE
jgi:hypothetical protein